MKRVTGTRVQTIVSIPTLFSDYLVYLQAISITTVICPMFGIFSMFLNLSIIFRATL